MALKPMRLLLCCAFFLTQSRAALAQRGDDVFNFLEEEAKVVTASRRSEAVREAPVAVEIITAEEIRNSGAVNLWDFMRFRAGMNVVDGRSGDGNRAIVSVRGFPAEFVDKLLVLVDGRSVYTGLSGGAVWDQLPVQTQDIERIEIVRGPNAALYGSNAGLGVINIITKKPQADRTAFVDALGGTRGLRREQASFEDGDNRGAYKLSFAQKAQNGYPTPANVPGNDFLFSNKANFRGLWKPTSKSALELFGGESWDTQGVLDSTDPQGRFHTDYQMLKYAYTIRSNSSIEALAARRDDVKKFDPNFLGLLSVREYQYDAELVHRFAWLDNRMRTVYGGSLRYTGVDSGGIFAGNPYQKNAVQRGFGSQSWAVFSSLNLIGAVSVEHSDTGGTQPAYQLAAVASAAKDHTFRFSYGLAPTIPTLYDRSANQRASATVLLVGNPQIEPQQLRSYEASYQGAFLEKRMLLETNLFYMDVDRLSQTVVRSYSFPLLTLSFDNGNKAAARGAEMKATYRWTAKRSLYANYTYETISDAKNNINVRRGTPAYKVNIGGLFAFGRGFSANVNAGYQDGHTLNSQATGQTLDIPAYWRLDARLSYALPWRDAEIYVAGQNLLRPTHVEFADGLVVPRTYLAGVSIKFNAGR